MYSGADYANQLSIQSLGEGEDYPLSMSQKPEEYED
jgi:hypothetical protein